MYFDGYAQHLYSSKESILITNTTSSNSVSTGALVVSGGAGIAGNLYAKNLILNMAASRIEMSDNTNKFSIGASLSDGAGDIHILDRVVERPVLSYFRNTNTVRLGDSNTTLQVGTNTVAMREWTSSQGFLKTTFIHSISLTPTASNSPTSISFSANTNNSGSNFSIGRGISGLTSNEF